MLSFTIFRSDGKSHADRKFEKKLQFYESKCMNLSFTFKWIYFLL